LRERWKRGSPHFKNYDLSGLELKFMKLGVETAEFHELFVVAPLDNLSVFDYEDDVGFTNGGEPMSNDDRSMIFHQSVDGFEDQLF
jgi:hypothetical protein